METNFKKPLSFGGILDLTFSVSKRRFKDFFLIFLILIGPIYLVQAIIQLILGASFFRGKGTGSTWYEQIAASINGSQSIASGNVTSGLGIAGIGFISSLLIPVALASILIAMDCIRKEEEFSVKSVIKQAFSRYWPILGSSILFGLIAFGMLFIPIIIISLTGAFASMVNLTIGIILTIILGLACVVVIGYLLTRWSFFFGSVVLDKDAPGFVRSWHLTRKRAWTMMGIYIIIYLIITGITLAIDMSLDLLLGGSVLLYIISNIVKLITTMFFGVGYAIMFLDLKTRHDAEDLKELIDEYNRTPNQL